MDIESFSVTSFSGFMDPCGAQVVRLPQQLMSQTSFCLDLTLLGVAVGGCLLETRITCCYRGFNSGHFLLGSPAASGRDAWGPFPLPLGKGLSVAQSPVTRWPAGLGGKSTRVQDTRLLATMGRSRRSYLAVGRHYGAVLQPHFQHP